MKYNKLYEIWNRHLEEEVHIKEEVDLEKYAKYSRNDLIELIVELEEATVEQQQTIVELESEIADLTGSDEDRFEEKLETVVSEDSESDTAMVNLLSQISQKLDGLEDIDTSIDYLIGALSGETALSAKMKQSTLGRFADASPQMAELIKKHQE